MATTPAITFREVVLDDDFSGILDLYRAHNWTHARSPERLKVAIAASSFAVVAVTGDGTVIGFARAMSDEAFAVYIADILVAPEWQRRGIGRRITRTLLDRYPLDTFHHQVLIAEPGAEGFYRRLGMAPVSLYGLTAFIRTQDRPD